MMNRGQDTHPKRVNAKYEMKNANSFSFQEVPEILSTGGQIHRWKDGWTNGWTDVRMNQVYPLLLSVERGYNY